jgi:hypothetical protein
MAKQDPFYKDPCAKKRRYKSEKSAKAALMMMRRRAGRGGGWAAKFVVKSCDGCGGWHVGKPDGEESAA